MGRTSRFEATVKDLWDCLDHIQDENLSESEQWAREQLIQACLDIVSATRPKMVQEKWKITTHPFVSTPKNGPCSSCGKLRSDQIHKGDF
jgi:hypothetical protein